MLYLTIVNKIIRHCHSWLARQYKYIFTYLSFSWGDLFFKDHFICFLMSMYAGIDLDWLQSLKQLFINVSSHTCGQSYSDGSVLEQSHQKKTGHKYMI